MEDAPTDSNVYEEWKKDITKKADQRGHIQEESDHCDETLPEMPGPYTGVRPKDIQTALHPVRVRRTLQFVIN